MVLASRKAGHWRRRVSYFWSEGSSCFALKYPKNYDI